jgi:hypothetical protein
MDGLALKEARKRMYQELRLKYPYADKQVIKSTAYDMTREAVNNLNEQGVPESSPTITIVNAPELYITDDDITSTTVVVSEQSNG